LCGQPDIWGTFDITDVATMPPYRESPPKWPPTVESRFRNIVAGRDGASDLAKSLLGPDSVPVAPTPTPVTIKNDRF